MKPPEAPGRAARLALRQPAEQMLPGSEPISAHGAGALAGGESRRSPACQGCADSCQPAKALGRWASPGHPSPGRSCQAPAKPPRTFPLPLPGGGQGRRQGPGALPTPRKGRQAPSWEAARRQGWGPACPALPGPVRAI